MMAQPRSADLALQASVARASGTRPENPGSKRRAGGRRRARLFCLQMPPAEGGGTAQRILRRQIIGEGAHVGWPEIEAAADEIGRASRRERGAGPVAGRRESKH